MSWRIPVLFVCASALLALPAPAAAAAFVQANLSRDAYLLLHETLGGNPYETPDCGHAQFGPHITQAYDPELRRDVFEFHLHLDEDNDRCMKYDRQRTEIKTNIDSGERRIARKGETHTYQWKFKLDRHFQPSRYWSHIFQIKPAKLQNNPLFTFSPQANENGLELRLRHDDGSGMRNLTTLPLEPMLGEWVQATVKVYYDNPHGRLAVKLLRLRDREVLLDWQQSGLNLYRRGSGYNVPKWGLYRSLQELEGLRDEIVRYNDICIAEGRDTCPENLPEPWHKDEYLNINPFPGNLSFDGNGLMLIVQRLFLSSYKIKGSSQPENLGLGRKPIDYSVTAPVSQPKRAADIRPAIDMSRDLKAHRAAIGAVSVEY